MLCGIGLFVDLDWARFALWIAALAGGALAFGAIGVAIGALAREVRAASLLAFLLALPIAFLALVPAGAVAGCLYDVDARRLGAVPVQARRSTRSTRRSTTRDRVWRPRSGISPVLAVAYLAIARAAIARFA